VGLRTGMDDAERRKNYYRVYINYIYILDYLFQFIFLLAAFVMKNFIICTVYQKF
jgi:hypothetical protein